MIFSKHVFLAWVIAVYTVAFIATFDELYDSVAISSIALIGLCAWFYGYRTGFFSILFFVLLNTAILFYVSGKPYDILLTYNPTGIIMAIILVVGMGYLKESCDKLNALQSSLESRFDKSTAKLDKLARQLIENDERERIQIGQNLHDSVGQYLTCMLLHCEALYLSLKNDNQSEADLAEWMTRRIQANIQAVRQLSRSLLPIQLNETSFETSLKEMAAYFSEVSNANIKLSISENNLNISIATSQHLYRIAQEAVYQGIYHYKVTHVDIRLTTDGQSCRIRVNGVGATQEIPHTTPLVSEVMKYRIRAIGGNPTVASLEKDGFCLECVASNHGEAV